MWKHVCSRGWKAIPKIWKACHTGEDVVFRKGMWVIFFKARTNNCTLHLRPLRMQHSVDKASLECWHNKFHAWVNYIIPFIKLTWKAISLELAQRRERFWCRFWLLIQVALSPEPNDPAHCLVLDASALDRGTLWTLLQTSKLKKKVTAEISRILEQDHEMPRKQAKKPKPPKLYCSKWSFYNVTGSW